MSGVDFFRVVDGPDNKFGHTWNSHVTINTKIEKYIKERGIWEEISSEYLPSNLKDANGKEYRLSEIPNVLGIEFCKNWEWFFSRDGKSISHGFGMYGVGKTLYVTLILELKDE